MSPNRDVEKMRIAHVMSWYIPNLGYQENFLPAEQAKLGHEVHIVTSDRMPDYGGYEHHVGRVVGKRIVGEGRHRENGVDIHRLPISLELNHGNIVLLKGLRAKLDEISPEIVHAHGAFIPLTAEVVFHSRRLGYKVFVDDHSHEDNFHIDSLSKRLYMFLIRTYYNYYKNSVCCWLPVTYSAERIVKNQLNLSGSRVRILDLGSDSKLFRKSTELREIGRRELGIDDGTILVVSAGKFDEPKETHRLLKAVETVREKHPEIAVLLVGGGPADYMSNLRDLIHSSPLLRGKVIFKDFVPNKCLPIYYNAGDIGVWPGDHTITAIEAASTGLPCILPANTLAYNVLFDDDAARSFERGNLGSLTAALEELAANADLRSRISRNSMRIVEGRLSWKRVALESELIYTKCSAPVGGQVQGGLVSSLPGRELIVTTSWDDGTVSDMKLSALMENLSIKGTFYVSCRHHYLERPLTFDEIRELGRNNEIGAHTISHPRLDRLSIDEATAEIVKSRQYLQECLGRQIDMFCYPYGKYNDDVVEVVRNCGFIGARTCEPAVSEARNDPFRWRITLHASNGSPLTTLRIWRANGLSFASIADWEQRAKELFDHAIHTGGVYHLWGHSSEIEKRQEWDKLSRVFEHISKRPHVRYLSNGGCLRSLSSSDSDET